VTPTKADFDNAVKQQWGTRTCLVAQMMKRCNIPTDSPTEDGVETFADKHKLRDVMHVFDRHFNYPGDEKKEALVALREELPNE
jgi:hypothetical protein